VGSGKYGFKEGSKLNIQQGNLEGRVRWKIENLSFDSG
jgi:hypothetical protein